MFNSVYQKGNRFLVEVLSKDQSRRLIACIMEAGFFITEIAGEDQTMAEGAA